MPFWGTFTSTFGSGRSYRSPTAPGPQEPLQTYDGVNYTSLSLPAGVSINTNNTKLTDRSLEFDGTHQAGSLVFDLTAAFGLQNSITIESWVYFTNINRMPWSVENGVQAGGIYSTSSPPVIGFYQVDRTGTGGASNTGTSASFSLNQWVLVTTEIEYNGSTTRARRYVNGALGSTFGPIGVAGDKDYSMPGMPTLVLGNFGNSGTIYRFSGFLGPIKVSRGLLYNSSTAPVATAPWTEDTDTILILQ